MIVQSLLRNFDPTSFPIHKKKVVSVMSVPLTKGMAQAFEIVANSICHISWNILQQIKKILTLV